MKIKKHISINDRAIGADYPPYVIGEVSANHNGDFERAVKIMEVAKQCGCDAVKLQTYTPDTITIDCDKPDFRINGGLWDKRSLYDLYSEAHLPWEWHKPLFDEARRLGLTIFSSPFDKTAVDLLEDLGVPAYKIASFEAIDIPLIEYVATTGKPMIISTGMADALEIEEAVTAARDSGCKDLILLHCVSGYPAPIEDYNLATLSDLQKRFNTLVGLSDHTIDNTAAIVSIGFGACVIEKHITLDRSDGGPDDSFSLEESDLVALCQDVKKAWRAVGRVNYERKQSESDSLIFRRSLYAVKDISAGEEISIDNVRSIRPGYGLKPKHLREILGKTAKVKIERGDKLEWRLLDGLE